jgi:H/ACA ribonucleoprotein complex subunit 3
MMDDVIRVMNVWSFLFHLVFSGVFPSIDCFIIEMNPPLTKCCVGKVSRSSRSVLPSCKSPLLFSQTAPHLRSGAGPFNLRLAENFQTVKPPVRKPHNQPQHHTSPSTTPPKTTATMHLMYLPEANGSVSRRYTLQKVLDGQVTKSAHPARFSPDDKWSRHRIAVRKRFAVLLAQQSTFLPFLRRLSTER